MPPVCNCAIYVRGLPLQAEDSSGNGRQAHLTNIPGGRTQSIQGFRGVEIQHIAEIIIHEMLCRVDIAPGKKHVPNAVLQGSAVFYLNIEVVQLLQKAAFLVAMQLREVIRHMILYSVFRCGEKRQRQIGAVFQCTKAVFQRFNDRRSKFRAHDPDWDRPRKPTFMGVGNVKVVFQP